jgi:hypothetical protein
MSEEITARKILELMKDMGPQEQEVQNILGRVMFQENNHIL